MDYVMRADERAIELRGVAVMPHHDQGVGGLVNGLDTGRPWIVTGIVMGPVRIGVQVLTQPPVVVADGWEDIVELSCKTVEPPVLATGPYADAPHPQYAIDPPGAEWFRLRVHARHRDAAFDLAVSQSTEEYLLVSWPSPPRPPVVLAVGSDLAKRYQGSSPRASKRAEGRSASEVSAAPGFTETPQDAARRARAETNLLRISRRTPPPAG